MMSFIGTVALAYVFSHRSLTVTAGRLKQVTLHSVEEVAKANGACPVPKSDFLEGAGPYTFEIEATPTSFSPGGFGWKWRDNSVKIQPLKNSESALKDKFVRAICTCNFIVRGSKQGKSGLTEAEFMDNASPLKPEFTAEAYEFSTGSFGWEVNGKMKMNVSGNSLNLQYNLNCPVYGSKPKDGDIDPFLTKDTSSAIEKWLPTIGEADETMADNLKLIKGIGPFIENRLNHIRIYTFDQIAKMTPEIEEDVVKAIVYFPGRHRRDNWVEQAKKLAAKKKGVGAGVHHGGASGGAGNGDTAVFFGKADDVYDDDVDDYA